MYGAKGEKHPDIWSQRREALRIDSNLGLKEETTHQPPLWKSGPQEKKKNVLDSWRSQRETLALLFDSRGPMIENVLHVTETLILRSRRQLGAIEKSSSD